MSFAGRHFVKNAVAGKIADVTYRPSLGELSIFPVSGSKSWHLLGVSPASLVAIRFVKDDYVTLCRSRTTRPVGPRDSFADHGPLRRRLLG